MSNRIGSIVRCVGYHPQRSRGVAAVFLMPLTLCLASAGTDSGDQPWARFRGPNGSGVSDTKGLPLRFGPNQNLIWKTPLPPGHSSPVLTDERVFLTAARGENLLTLSLDRKTGRLLWERAARRDRTEAVDDRNTPASPTPVTDGEAVYVFFPDLGLVSFDLDGRERWRFPLGPFNNLYGMGASPILVDDKVVLVCDQNTHSFLIAIGKADGRVRWKTPRPEATSGHSTPVVYRPAEGPAQIVVPGSFFLTAYAADTGEKIWWVQGLSFEMKSTPVMSDDTVYINGFGFPENQSGTHVALGTVEEVFGTRGANEDRRLSAEELPDDRTRRRLRFMDLDGDGYVGVNEWRYYRAAVASENGILAIRLGGRGDMTETNLLWRYHKAVPQLPSPLLYKDVLYMVNDGGIVTSLDPSTGALVKQGRLRGAIDKYFASPVAADGKIFMVSETGKVAVLSPDGNLGVLAVNDLGEDSYATPAIADGRIYIRTLSTLYCFGK